MRNRQLIFFGLVHTLHATPHTPALLDTQRYSDNILENAVQNGLGIFTSSSAPCSTSSLIGSGFSSFGPDIRIISDDSPTPPTSPCQQASVHITEKLMPWDAVVAGSISPTREFLVS